MQYYADSALAEQYARSRPFFHPVVIEHIRQRLGIPPPLDRALDIACGVGQSSVPLRGIAERVVGIDGAREMVAAAFPGEGVAYALGLAELLPFHDGAFPLITVSRAFHWFNRGRFLAEARRVLRAEGWLILYGNRFVDGRIADNQAFNTWLDEYQRRYPGPPRDYTAMTADDAEGAGFRLAERQPYTNQWSFALDDLVDYLMTLSRATLAIETGAESEHNIRQWLTESLWPFFAGGTASFQFSGTIEYLQRA